MTHRPRVALLAAVAVVLTGVALVAGIKIKIQEDKTFDFTGLRTYAWQLDPKGTVKILQNTGDDPAEIRANIEPTVLAAVERELTAKGFTKVTSGTPDVYVDYYLLVGPAISSQYQGQFVGAVPAWGLPDFAMSASSYKAFEQGSLVVDVISAREQQIVWRVVAEAGIDRQRSAAQRQKIISDAATQMFKKFPPKFKKQ